MIRPTFYTLLMVTGLLSCSRSGPSPSAAPEADTSTHSPALPPHLRTPAQAPQDSPIAPLDAFIPPKLNPFDTICGDLNADSLPDCVLILKGTDPALVVENTFGERVDRNRRGLVILFQEQGKYRQVLLNKSCFLSENEDGGVYYPPELSVHIENRKLYIQYEHGRYGNWGYTFRYQNGDFELIGYDQTDAHGPVIDYEISINYLTRKKQVKRNTNEAAQGGDEVFEETWSDISSRKRARLSEIRDFDGFSVPE